MWSAREIEGLRRLLMEHWDPIGVYDISDDDESREAYWDEYDSRAIRRLPCGSGGESGPNAAQERT